jgi:hypothetical protein
LFSAIKLKQMGDNCQHPQAALCDRLKLAGLKKEEAGMRQLLVLMVVLLLHLNSVAPAGATGPFTYRALKGIEQVTVTMEHIAPELKPVVDSTKLQAAIELRLKQSGLKVSASAKDASFGSVVFVNVYATQPNPNTPLSHFIDVCLSRNVFLSPTDPKPYGSKVWQTGAMGQLDSSKLKQFPAKVLASVDEFIKDWKAANGR